LRHQVIEGNKITLPFPAPVIIFLEHTEATPDEVILELDFGERGKIDYPVQTMKFLNYSVEELCEKKNDNSASTISSKITARGRKR